MINILDVSVPGVPMGKQRPRVSFRGGKARAYTPQRTVDWESYAASLLVSAYEGPPLEGPLAILVLAIAPRPKRLLRKSDPDGRILRITKPDGDNVLKCCADALVIAGVVRDDCHIASWSCVGYYAARDEGPQVIIKLEEFEVAFPGVRTDD